MVMLAGCVSNKTVQTVQIGDDMKSCDALKFELVQLGANFENTKDDSGVTGKNVGLAIVFWPGIIFNEVRANKNEDSIQNRISHLTALYNEECSSTSRVASGDSLKEKLLELRELHDQGLINDEEYEMSRKKMINNQ